MSATEIKNMREKQAQLAAEARSDLSAATAENADETVIKEAESRFDQRMKDHDDLEAKATRMQKLLDAETSAAEEAERQAEIRTKLPPLPDGESDGDEETRLTKEQVFTRALQYGAQSLEPEQRAMLVRSSVGSEESRALSAGTNSAGGFLVPEGFYAEITKRMAIWGPMLDGDITRVIRTDSGNPLPFPTVDDTANTGESKAENAAAAEQDVAFGQAVMNAYMHDSGIVRISYELLQDNGFDIDALLNELFAERIGRRGNDKLTVGTGTNESQGIVVGSSSGKTAASANAVTMDELIDLQHSVDAAYRASPSCRWMFNDITLSVARKLKDGQGNYLWQPADARTGSPETLLGNSFSVNQAMPAMATGTKPVVFGDFSKYIVRQVKDLSVIRMNERFADHLQVGFLAYNRVDGRLIDTNAVKHLVMA